MQNWLKENWFKIGILAIGVSILFVALFGDNIVKKISPISAEEYRDLNEECIEFGIKKYGEEGLRGIGIERVEDRSYKYSVPLKTCVMKYEFETFPENMVIYLQLIDIYLDEEIIGFDRGCLEFSDNIDACTAVSDVLAKEKEIWGDRY